MRSLAALLQLYTTGTSQVNLIIGGSLFLVAYLTLAPILGALMPQDINNLETILCKTRTVATLAEPVLDYEAKLLSVIGRD